MYEQLTLMKYHFCQGCSALYLVVLINAYWLAHSELHLCAQQMVAAGIAARLLTSV